MKPKRVKVTKVTYGRTVNTGNYSSTRFDLCGDVVGGDWRAALGELQRLADGVEKRIKHGLAVDEDV